MKYDINFQLNLLKYLIEYIYNYEFRLVCRGVYIIRVESYFGKYDGLDITLKAE